MVRNGVYEEVIGKQRPEIRGPAIESKSRDKGPRCSGKSKKTFVKSWISF